MEPIRVPEKVPVEVGRTSRPMRSYEDLPEYNPSTREHEFDYGKMMVKVMVMLIFLVAVSTVAQIVRRPYDPF